MFVKRDLHGGFWARATGGHGKLKKVFNRRVATRRKMVPGQIGGGLCGSRLVVPPPPGGGEDEPAGGNCSPHFQNQGDRDFEEALVRAKTANSFLGNIHLIALAHILRRTILLIGSRSTMSGFGIGFHGVSGTFLPLRFLEVDDEFHPTAASKTILGGVRPIVLAWGSENRDHFVSLTAVAARNPSSGDPSTGFPVPCKPSHQGTFLKDPFEPPLIYLDALSRSVPDQYLGCWKAGFVAPAAGSSKLVEPRVQPVHLPTGSLRGYLGAVDALLLMKHCCGPEDVTAYKTALQTVRKMLTNLFNADAKFRRINTTAVCKRIGRELIGAVEVLLCVGFEWEQGSETEDRYLVLKPGPEREFSGHWEKVITTIDSILAGV